jgi:hypothetical protein
MVALWLVLAGVLGAAHSAHVAHVVDARTGELRHAAVTVGASSSSHLVFHAVRGDSDHDLCAIEAALHQAARLAPAGPAVALPALALDSRTPTAHAAAVFDAIYLFAPKTSPPTIV